MSYRKYISGIQLFDTLTNLGEASRDIINAIVEACSSPGVIFSVDGTKYKFRFNKESGKFEDNLISESILKENGLD